MGNQAPMVSIAKDASSYPELLRHIPDPPPCLYARGNIALLKTFCFSIVGSRDMSEYGQQACTAIAEPLAAAGMTIVSGLALGIDAVAHRAALDAGGATIAVLAAGVDDATIGPVTNRPLAEEILEHNGLLLSEYPPGTPAHPRRFPERNRIISGLSRGVLIVEAREKSGSLITARSALAQNRDVFAVPGPIFSPQSAGTHWLLANGAQLVSQAHDILTAYEPEQIPLLTSNEDVSTE